MRKVTVEKAQLLEKLRDNRVKHVADFEIAWDAFREKAVENTARLLDRLKRAPRGGPVELFVGLAPPINHADDYDRAMDMLSWEVGETLELTEAEFQNYVLDQWGWTAQAVASNVMYTGSASPSSRDDA